MISPNLVIAENSDSRKCSCRSYIYIGFDVGAKYYYLKETHEIINDGVHIETNKRMIVTIAQAEKLRDNLNSLFGIHEKYK